MAYDSPIERIVQVDKVCFGFYKTHLLVLRNLFALLCLREYKQVRAFFKLRYVFLFMFRTFVSFKSADDFRIAIIVIVIITSNHLETLRREGENDSGHKRPSSSTPSSNHLERQNHSVTRFPRLAISLVLSSTSPLGLVVSQKYSDSLR